MEYEFGSLFAMLRNPVWFHVLLAFALAVPGAAQTPGGGASILGIEY